jgi:hypothetical protein
MRTRPLDFWDFGSTCGASGLAPTVFREGFFTSGFSPDNAQIERYPDYNYDQEYESF